MKKLICVIFSCLLLTGICSCGNGQSHTSSSNSTSSSRQSTNPRNTFDGEEVLSQLELQSYFIETKFIKYAVVTIKNNSEYNLSITVNINFYDKAGALIGVDSETQEAVESGYETVFCFMVDNEAENLDGEYTVKEETRYDCVLSDLSYESTEAKDKIILSVTNNGDEVADFVKAYVIFFDNSLPVDFDWTYVTDNDSEIKPGRTVKKEISCYESFDSYLVFFSGRR